MEWILAGVAGVEAIAILVLLKATVGLNAKLNDEIERSEKAHEYRRDEMRELQGELRAGFEALGLERTYRPARTAHTTWRKPEPSTVSELKQAGAK